MPAILISLLLKYALPFVIKELVKGGVVEAEKATGITSVEQLVSHLKTYQQYPTGKNGA